MSAPVTYCANCGAPNDGGGFCTSCGARLPEPGIPVAAGYPVQPPPPPPPQGPDRTWIPVVSIVLVVVLACAGGLVLWKQLGDSGPEASSASSRPDSPRTPRTTPTADVAASPVPSTQPQRPRWRCPDGSLVAGAGICRVDTAGAALAAFGLRASECARTTLGADHAGPVNFLCRSGQIHLAVYQNAQKRLARLQAYGLGSGGCVARPGGIIICGPTRTGRTIRSYDTASGILIYASVERGGAGTLNALTQLTVDQLRSGTRVP